jgi:ketosteroid isomerase-like protein
VTPPDAVVAWWRAMADADLTALQELAEVRDLGDAAVCSYTWSETGTHDGAGFSLSGVATDVLVREDGRWLHRAHHVSMLPAGGRTQ